MGPTFLEILDQIFVVNAESVKHRLFNVLGSEFLFFH
jgi:hypothetical protein